MERNSLTINDIKDAAQHMRRDMIELTYKMGKVGAHIGGGLSLAEIFAVLYLKVLNIDVSDMTNEERDRVILSKGHGTLALYTAMKEAGILTEDDLKTFKDDDSMLSAHPSINPELGIEFSSGSLGQGLSLGVGMCLGLKRKNNDSSRVFAILGDGECDEGSVWEAAQSAAHFKCNNLIAIVDNNKLQYDGPTDDIMSFGNMSDKWRSFGWEVREVDGHNVEELIEAMSKIADKPLAIIANTVKGKGVSFMENNPEWHNHSLDNDLFNKALRELE